MPNNEKKLTVPDGAYLLILVIVPVTSSHARLSLTLRGEVSYCLVVEK
jgi:hypothetical protein